MLIKYSNKMGKGLVQYTAKNKIPSAKEHKKHTTKLHTSDNTEHYIIH